jgi:hypothetical protein
MDQQPEDDVASSSHPGAGGVFRTCLACSARSSKTRIRTWLSLRPSIVMP